MVRVRSRRISSIRRIFILGSYTHHSILFPFWAEIRNASVVVRLTFHTDVTQSVAANTRPKKHISDFVQLICDNLTCGMSRKLSHKMLASLQWADIQLWHRYRRVGKSSRARLAHRRQLRGAVSQRKLDQICEHTEHGSYTYEYYAYASQQSALVNVGLGGGHDVSAIRSFAIQDVRCTLHSLQRNRFPRIKRNEID